MGGDDNEIHFFFLGNFQYPFRWVSQCYHDSYPGLVRYDVTDQIFESSSRISGERLLISDDVKSIKPFPEAA